MTKSDILEQLYDRLPNREADDLINLLLDYDPEGMRRAEAFLRGKPESKKSYNLFQGIMEKPICKTVAKFMDGELLDAVQVCKMLSSILTQIFIQCELRGLASEEFDIPSITDLLNETSRITGNISKDSELYTDIRSEIKNLGWGTDRLS